MPKKMKAEVHDEKHFFLSSVATWRVGIDLVDMIIEMKKEGYPFSVWSVPVPLDSNYEIRMYAPQVEGAILLLTYGMED